MGKEQFTEPEWSEDYIRLLDAIGEYMDTIGKRDNPDITERDITIIRALIEFYDFEVDGWEDVMDILSDVATRAEELDEEMESNKH